MYVNNYKIRQPHLSGTTGVTISIPFGQNPELAGQQEIIDTKFVDIEVENSINEIFDYEKVRFLPRSKTKEAEGIHYKVNFLNGSGAYDNTTFWDYLDFTYDDFNLFKNSFSETFLRLDFFDSDIGTSQRLLFFSTLYPRFLNSDYQPNGSVPEPFEYPVLFRLGNSIKDRTAIGEGYFIYYFKDEVIPTVPKNIYMRATFLNAKNGKTTRFMSSNNPNNSIDVLARTTIDTNVVNKLYTKYELKRDIDGYYYEINENYSDNVSSSPSSNGDIITVNLYEISSS